MSNEVYTTYALYLLERTMRWVVIKSRQYEVGLVSGSFEPFAPEPQVANKLAKGAKDKSQTQGDEEYGECQDENRGDAAPLVSLNRSPCCTT